MESMIKAWMPISKTATGDFVGILSDTSIDRDDEFMTKNCLQKWAEAGVLPALANHENKMEKLVGSWSELKVIAKNGHHALIAKPKFFSAEANPLAAQIKKQLEEAIDMGLNVGISIGAIPKKSITKEIDGKNYKGYDEAELVEATLVPIQSNRNASYGHIAKQFDFKESEVSKMPENVNIEKELKYTQKDFDEMIFKVKKECDDCVAAAEAKVVEAEAKVEEASKKAEEAVAGAKAAEDKVAEAQAKAEESEKKLNEYKEKNVPSIDDAQGTMNKKFETDEPLTVKSMLKVGYGMK